MSTPLDTSWIDGLVGYHLRRRSSAMAVEYARAAGPDRLRPVLVLMLELIDANPGINQTELGDVLGIQRANMVPLVSQLIDRDLIVRQRSASDGRKLTLELSPSGRTALEAGKWLIEDHERRMTARLTPAERELLITMLRRIGEDER